MRYYCLNMKKIIILIAALLSMSAMLVSCTGNTVTDGNTTEKPSSSSDEKATEGMSEDKTGDNIIDDAKNRLEEMSEDATHGIDDGSFGGDSTRGGSRTLFPRGK